MYFDTWIFLTLLLFGEQSPFNYFSFIDPCWWLYVLLLWGRNGQNKAVRIIITVTCISFIAVTVLPFTPDTAVWCGHYYQHGNIPLTTGARHPSCPTGGFHEFFQQVGDSLFKPLQTTLRVLVRQHSSWIVRFLIQAPTFAGLWLFPYLSIPDIVPSPIF